MSRIFNNYKASASAAHAQGVTAGTATLTAPTSPVTIGCYLSVTINDAYVTFDGSTPSSTNGLFLKASTNPQYFPLGEDIKIAPVTGSTTVNVLWLS